MVYFDYDALNFKLQFYKCFKLRGKKRRMHLCIEERKKFANDFLLTLLSACILQLNFFFKIPNKCKAEMLYSFYKKLLFP